MLLGQNYNILKLKLKIDNAKLKTLDTEYFGYF